MSSPGQTGFDYDPDKNVAKHILLKTRTIPSRTCWRHISRLHEAKGLQRLRYSIYPHAGDWRRAQVHRRASEYQEPLFCIVGKRGRRAPGPTLPATDSLIQVRPDSVVMTGLYREGDRVVARLYESHGERCQAELVFPFAIAAAAETDFYGERLDGGKAVSVSAQRLSFAMAPWEVRNPSPRKLNDRIIATTNSPGSSSHGVATIALTFCAAFNSTPQLMAGGCRPMPRKLSAVSPRIIHGIASVPDAMTWLRNDGTRWRNI